MDLQAEALRLRLDALAVELSRCLAAAGLPHAVLKGPSTSLWLHHPPRPYRDVDLLVPRSAVDAVVAVLSADGLAARAAGRVGEEAPHSLMLRSAEGFEVDLHVSLPLVPVVGDRIWTAVAEHLVELDLGVGTVPVLDEAGRCVVLALHALANGPGPGQARDDLERAWHRCGSDVWRDAHALADAVGAGDLVRGGLSLVGADPGTLSRRAQLHVASASAEALGLSRIADARGIDRLRLVAGELVPSAGFLRWDDPTLPPTRRALLGAHLRRWRRIAGRLPGAVRAYRDAGTR